MLKQLQRSRLSPALRVDRKLRRQENLGRSFIRIAEGDSVTPIANILSILAEFWMENREDEEFEDYVAYNDLGLPLAYAANSNLVALTPEGQAMVEETFKGLLDTLELSDTGFVDLDEIFLA